jgi:hypothetical protein
MAIWRWFSVDERASTFLRSSIILVVFPHWCRNPSLNFTTKARGIARLRAKREACESHHMLPRLRRMQGVWENAPSRSQVNSHCASWRPNGLLNFQSAIVGVQTHRIKQFFISLESYWNLDVSNGLACPSWTFETQVMIKREVRSQIANLTPDH